MQNSSDTENLDTGSIDDELLHILGAEYADFLKDFGTSEPFLIDGDGLVARAISDHLLDWSRGGQFLHLTYIVETFLSKLRQAGAVFEVFFFTGNSAIFNHLSPSLRLARDAIVKHLSQSQFSENGVKVHRLSGTWIVSSHQKASSQADPEKAREENTDWEILVGTFNPAFILSNDSVTWDTHVSTWQGCFVMECLLDGMHIVCMNDLTFEGSQVQAFVICPPLNADVRHRMGEQVKSINSKGFITRPSASQIVLHTPGFEGADELLATDFRGWLYVSSLAVLAHLTPTLSPIEEYFAAILIVKMILLKNLRLEERAVTLPAAADDKTGIPRDLLRAVSSFSTKLQNVMVDRFASWSPPDQTYPQTLSCLPDLFDGRFYHALIYVGVTVCGRQWPDQILREGQSLWRASGMLSVSNQNFDTALQWPTDGIIPSDGVDQVIAGLLNAEHWQLSLRSKAHAERIPSIQSSITEDPFMPATLRLVQARISAVTQAKRDAYRATNFSSGRDGQDCASSGDEATWEDTCNLDHDKSKDISEETAYASLSATDVTVAVSARVATMDEDAASLSSRPESSTLRKFTTDHHFHSTKPLCKDPDHLQFAQMEERERTFTFKSAFHQNRSRLKAVQRQATAAVRYTESLLSGQPVTPQTIAEKLSQKKLTARCQTAIKSLSGSVIQSNGGSDSSVSGSARLQVDTRVRPQATRDVAHASGPSKASKKQGRVSGTATEVKRQNSERIQKDAMTSWSSKLLALQSLRPPVTSREYVTDAKAYIVRLLEHQTELAKAKATNKISESTHGQLLYALGLEVLGVLQTLPPASDSFRRKKTFITIQNILRTPHDCLRAVMAQADTGKGPKLRGGGQHPLVSAALSVGFFDLATQMAALFGFERPEILRGSVPVCSVVFQLQAAPEHLARPPGVDGNDPRVQFKPDEWQVRLLDIVDSGNSALVVAPTASGKTFISYYIMELCLRTDDEGVVVFVAPTKALVYQVWAELDARFSKQYKGKGKLSGVFTREHRQNVYDCQILVTVPQCLGILLLASDEDQQQWSTRLKHVIFDEVHMLGSAGGEVWEQLILLVPVPFVALSATLGDVESFHAWLRRVESTKQRDVYLVEHTERHNDLFPWVYDPQLQRMSSLHPFAVLRDLVERGPVQEFPEDLKILPEHCIDVAVAMHKHIPEERRGALTPERFFRARREDAEWNLSMQDVRAWEKEIKAEFCGLPRDVQSSVIEQVSGEALKAFTSVDRWMGSGTSERRMFKKHLPCLVMDLDRRGLFPALCFHFSRNGCQFFAQELVGHLSEQEQDARESEGWQSKVQSLERDINLLKTTKRAVGNTKEELMEEQMDGDDKRRALMATLDRLKGIDLRFMLVPTGGSPIQESEIFDALQMDKEDMEERFPDLVWLFNAMRRGVGVHHSGLPKKWRKAIEHLVRLKRLAVIFATGTLAMGINFPCKTSVLFGDATYLNSMLYRQVIGRAGRRGMDLRGHTVFYGLPSDKVCRLIRSRLPSLLGNVVLSPSLVLRLLMRQSLLRDAVQAAKGKRKEELQRHQLEAAGACARMVEVPLFAPCALLREQACHNFHFCIEFLRAQGLLMHDESGIAPNDLSAFIAHLFFMEPANFAFLTLLQSGYLAQLCEPRPSEAKTLREERVVTLLSQLFGQLPVPSRVAKWLREHKRVGPSMVVLEELAEEPLSILKQHSTRAVETLQDFWQSFAVAFETELGADNKLPLTGRVQGGCAPERADYLGSEGVQTIERLMLKCRVRSSFVALSGHDDHFHSVADVCTTTRAGLHVDSKLVPVFQLRDSDTPLNSYLLDFYKHGQQSALVRYNGLKADSVWNLLLEFDLCLRALLAAMERRTLVAQEWDRIANRNVLETFRVVSERFHRQLKEIAA